MLIIIKVTTVILKKTKNKIKVYIEAVIFLKRTFAFLDRFHAEKNGGEAKRRKVRRKSKEGKKTGKQGAEEGITEDFGPTLAQYSFDSATAR